jgi:hypothetical protein
MYNLLGRKINFDYYFYFFFNNDIKFFYFFDVYMIYFLKMDHILNLLNQIFLKKLKLIQEKKCNNFNNNNILVKKSRLKKEKKYQILKFLNISEFVYSEKQKEIYLKKFNRITFFISSNLILQKKFIEEKFYFLKLNKIFNLFFMKIKTLGNIFFIQYRIYGLGFKIKKSALLNTRSLRFDLGLGHGIYYKLPFEIKCLKRKRRFLLYSNNFPYLVFIKNHIDKFKLLNPYKIRGLKDLKNEIKMKKGKKQSKK